MNFESLRERLNEVDPADWKRIRAAARAGDAEAQYLLGSRVYFGLGRRGCEKWLRAAAAQGHPEALYSLAITTFDGNSPVWTSQGGEITPERREQLIQAAELGSPRGLKEWADYLWLGEHGFERDFVKARELYLRAAELGNAIAQMWAGWMIVRGDGGPQDFTRGVALLEEVACGSDNHSAMNAVEELVRVYEGLEPGGQPDSQKAAYWNAQHELFTRRCRGEVAETEEQG